MMPVCTRSQRLSDRIGRSTPLRRRRGTVRRDGRGRRRISVQPLYPHPRPESAPSLAALPWRGDGRPARSGAGLSGASRRRTWSLPISSIHHGVVRPDAAIDHHVAIVWKSLKERWGSRRRQPYPHHPLEPVLLVVRVVGRLVEPRLTVPAFERRDAQSHFGFAKDRTINAGRVDLNR